MRSYGRGAVDVSVTWGEPIPYDGATDRKVLARQLESAVRRTTVAALRGAGGRLRRIAGVSFGGKRR